MIRVLRRSTKSHGAAQAVLGANFRCQQKKVVVSSSLALRPTRVNLVPIPPFVWKMLSVAGLFVIDAFLRAHRQQVKKMENEERENGDVASRPMAIPEALLILGFPETRKTPLTTPSDIADAEQRFHVLFEKAALAQSPYLQGKVVAAFEVVSGKAAPVPETVEQGASSTATAKDGEASDGKR